ncbi:MAG: N-acetyl-alpha-D-glucosaminyl L-malate synthase BshA [Acidobacteria bacterium]|nr:N-acetyl-alpha-D-glucosaminyl L-malate synthase BshA [Acidobacteriota bacterium]
MKIGITCYPTYGGSGIVATESGKELADRGHEIHFISYAPPLRLTGASANIQYHEVEVSNYPLFDHPPYTLALATKMAEIADTQGLDLLHCHYAIPHSVSAFLAKSMLEPLRLPVVTTLHGTDITLVGSDPSYLPITRFSIDQSDGVTAVSDFLKQETIRVLGAKNDIEVIYNFVNCEKYKPISDHPLRECLAPKNEKILIHVSNFRPVKRPADVVEVFVRVLKEIPSVLLMVGDGPERGNTERLVRNYGIGNHVHFSGKQDNIEEFIGISDLLLLPSETESFGLVALEAMACEVPVIATNVGGVPEVVRNGVDGFLTEPGDIEKMTDFALTILGDDSIRRRMGKSARETAKERFCSTKIIPMYESFYRKVLDPGCDA